MEGIHGVDVSWLHHSNKGTPRTIPPPPHKSTSDICDWIQANTDADIVYKTEHHHRLYAPTSPGLPRDTPPRTSSHGGHLQNDAEPAPAVQPPQPPPPIDTTSPKQTSTVTSKPVSKRPNLLGRSTSEKNSPQTPPPDPSKSSPRRGSWISSLSSKFSSQGQAPAQAGTQNGASQSPPSNSAKATPNGDTKGSAASPPNNSATSTAAVNGKEEHDDFQPYVPQAPKTGGSSFFSSALKRLSSGSQLNTAAKQAAINGGVCPRKVMNVDNERPRNHVPGLEDAKLRRVAFCVDVEIAGGPRYHDDEDIGGEKKKKDKGLKLKEKGEGAALKNPQAVTEEKENEGVVQASGEAVGTDGENPEGPVVDEGQEPDKKKEKKKKSEEERKERKERRRRKAEESGSVPVEINREASDNGSNPSLSSSPPIVGSPSQKSQDRPTTDPVRIYRRCCQLRETPVLKRISEQLSSPSSCPIDTPGIVGTLDLTGSRLQLSDVVTLGDWLAVVPVKRLLLEDADLSDEGVRVILAGLLAAKAPENRSRKYFGRYNTRKADERSGVIEKLILKNNPRVTRVGWKHVSLFLYMCRSLKAADVSMMAFPKDTAVSPDSASNSGPKKTEEDIAEIFAKSISQRLGGATLEELIMAECSLSSQVIRKIVDAVTTSGLRRLGVAGNRLDEEGLDHVLRYVKSGICQGLDLGGNDMRDRLDRLANMLSEKNELWALCLSDCNLSPTSLKPLFPALVRLPHFKFLDLSHNRDLCNTDPSVVSLLRKYVPQMPDFKRLHLVDVAMSPAQAIALAEILAEAPQFAHLNILENPQLTALATAKDEAGQEESVALYSSFMICARVSQSLVCVELEVPGQEASEIVKALAKQTVAYCLRNIQRWAVPGDADTAGAVASLSSPIEEKDKDTDNGVPNVLLHLVGHEEGYADLRDDEDPAPDEDYIVGGNGVVKALGYVLGEKGKRMSISASGQVTPKDQSKPAEDGPSKSMVMSKNLLGSARKIRARLRPTLIKEADTGDEVAYRRLLYLDTTLLNMIQRFEDEYPECRPSKPSSTPSTRSISPSVDTSASIATLNSSTIPVHAPADDDAYNDDNVSPDSRRLSRHGSDVSLAARALSQEEGTMHRFGQHIRRDILKPQVLDYAHNTSAPDEPEAEHLAELREKLELIGGTEIRDLVNRKGWEGALKEVGANAEELRELKEEGDEDWRRFGEAQRAAQVHSEKERNGEEKKVGEGKI
ncbi:MAG: hypothetical protein M1820_002586 [Bogoriella megaspora]|nr:MAG: hypothetical protein M1820_002586 [Bogoriella megaspora]